MSKIRVMYGDQILIDDLTTGSKKLNCKGKLMAEDISVEVVEIKPYLTFISPEAFTLAAATKGWDGTLQYSTDTNAWTDWDGTAVSSGASDDSQALYLRGTGNTVISGEAGDGFTLTGSNVSCEGSIETLLDYAVAAKGEHPSMGASCYRSLFYLCTALIAAPELPATTLAEQCYRSMFNSCANLVTAPELPATTLADNCYTMMFRNCTSLTTAPTLPATTAANACYYGMFAYCTALVVAPELPATTLAKQCYYSMFLGCTALVTAPALPATMLADGCYFAMFLGCTALVTAPALPATTLAEDCYRDMLSGCTALVTAPELPATTLAKRCYMRMFCDCPALVTIPELPATTLANECYSVMFTRDTKIKLSSTKTEEYTIAYRIPIAGNGTDVSGAMYAMFMDTGGTFTEDPSINTTYYLSNTNSVV